MKYDTSGKVVLTPSLGSGYTGRFSPDGSMYYTVDPDTGFCGLNAPDGSIYVKDVSSSSYSGRLSPNGSLRVTSLDENNGALKVSGLTAPVASWNASTSTLAQLLALASHSRPSLAMMFDSTGKLTYAPNNLLTQSNNFASVSWTKDTATITSGVSDPLGGTNAFTVTANAANAQVYQGVPFTGAGSVNFIQAIWVKRRTGSGTVSIYTPNGITKTSIAVNGSWQLFYTAGAGNVANIVYNTVFLDVSGDEVDIYFATLSAVTYETSPRTVDQVITTSAAYYGPRIDYDPNTLAVKGLLIEEARTNTALQSATLASGWSNDGVTGSPDSPDGTLWVDGGTAQKKIAQATTGPHTTYTSAPVTTTAGSTYSLSWNVKAGNYSKVYLCAGDGTRNAFATFDISGTADISASQASGASHTDISGSGKYLGSGWFRLTLTFTASAGSVADFLEVGIVQNLTGNTTNGFGEISWTAAGTETYYIGQPQYEVGAFPTSFIPTAASSVTRAADVVQFIGAALTALQGSAWSFLVQTTDIANTAGTTLVGAGYTAQHNIQAAAMFGSFNGTSYLNVTLPAGTFAAPQRVGVATDGSSRTVVASGAKATGAGGYPSAAANTYVGAYESGTFMPNTHIASFAIYNQRLPDATLQAKSVVGAW